MRISGNRPPGRARGNFRQKTCFTALNNLILFALVEPMNYHRLLISFFILIATLLFGTFSFYRLEDMAPFDAFYMTIITISTVGFQEVKPLSPYGRIVAIVVIVMGISVGGYTIGNILRMFIEGEISKAFGRKKLQQQINKLKDHFIVCGFGRIGQIICDDLHDDNIDFIVVEKSSAALEDLETRGYLWLAMDATAEETLLKAGIMRAKGLVTAVTSDADNVFITLTAKGIRPDIFILSRASETKNEGKLLKAGASRVVSPYFIGGKRMAQVLKRPTVVDFIDIAMMGNRLGLMMEEATLGGTSCLIDKSLLESRLRQDFGVIIVAIKKSSGEMIFNPLPSEKFCAGDVIVVMGQREDLKRMNQILK